MILTQFENFADEEREELRKEAHKKYQDSIIVENLQYDGKLTSFNLTIHKNNIITINYLPSLLHGPLWDLSEELIEKKDGEHGKFFKWVNQMVLKYGDK